MDLINPPLVTVRLHGPLADTYGGEHRFAIRTPREAVNALEANFPGFRRAFLNTQYYGIIADGDWRDEENYPDVADAPVGRELDFCPLIEGRFFAPILAGVTAIIGAGVAANIIAGVITVGLLLGVSMLLSPKPKKKTAEDSAKDDNYMFSGPENVTEQGVAVPLIYGRCFVGSVVVSAGLEVAEGGADTGASWIWDAPAMTATDRSRVAARQAGLMGDPQIGPPAPPRPGRTIPRWIPDNA